MTGARKVLTVRLTALETGPGAPQPLRPGDRLMEFHVSRKARDSLGFDASLFTSTGNIIIPDFHQARLLARRINERVGATLLPERTIKAGKLNAMALIDEILHDVARLFREQVGADSFVTALAALEKALGRDELDLLLHAFVEAFPPLSVHRGEFTAAEWLAEGDPARGGRPLPGVSKLGDASGLPFNRELALEELLLLRLANENPAFGPFRFLFDDGAPGFDSPHRILSGLAALPAYSTALTLLEQHFQALPPFGPDQEDLVSLLRAPMRAAPYSLPGQLDYMRRKWGLILGDKLLRLLGGLDLIREEEKPFFPGPGPTRTLVYSGMEKEYERFSPDRDWMPNVVMMAKTILVWLDQLSKAYKRGIHRLDQVPDEELDLLASRGFNALWLIGLWERSEASRRIKEKCGNPEAAASAYSLFDYEIAGEIGGWEALESLRHRAGLRGIRLAADMVPNHTGIDSAWMRERPDLFMKSEWCPFPGYSFAGENLSGDARVGLWLEDHYYDRTDAAVVFKRHDFRSGRTDYIYHGNDGTGLPWSDTAQLDFLNPATREAVKERILHVARNFPIIRFDAAMVLARKHFRRLWYPEPGHGGDVPSRAERGLSPEAFDAAMPEEFWREVVDLCARETPDTLLLAEAFWMMEGYFVRTLGMHRVYNSAFMNMLKREENQKYRETVRNTLEFDKDILKRFVNFMNNPDEETALAQFGKGDKYFGACTLMATMPGLPMFGHGQVEGFSEKYGMEYRRAYRDEEPDRDFIERHEREIFPLLRRRHLFSGVEAFHLYDLVGADGSVNENVFVYSNGSGDERVLVAYNNAYARAEGRIRESQPFTEKHSDGSRHLRRRSLAEALGFHGGEGRFLAMREQRSSLWFLRRSSEIGDEGLHLSLDGFQSQVFMEVCELVDDARGLYGALHQLLGGRGVPDLSEALEDLARKELYTLLAGLLSSDFLARLRLVAERAASPSDGAEVEARALLAGCLESGLAFFSALRKLVRDESSEEGFGPDSPETGSAAALGADAEAAGRARDRFAAGLARLLALVAGPPPRGTGAVAWLGREGGLETAAAFLVLDALAELSVAGALSEEETGGSAALEARRLAERLALERKLRETLRHAGLAGDRAWRGTALGKIIAGSEAPGPVRGAAGISKARAGFARLFTMMETDEELRGLLGVNVWDGSTWFNRESFEEFLDFAALATLLRGGSELAAAGRVAASRAGTPKTSAKARAAGDPLLAAREELARRETELAGDFDVVRTAEGASGYRLDRFLELLAPPPAPTEVPGPGGDGAKGALRSGKPSSGTSRSR